MGPEEDLAALKHRLAGLERENGDRMYLVDKRAAKALEESREAGDKLRRETDEALATALEQKRRAEAAGGWVTESTVGDKAEDDDFGFEEDEAENERRAGYRAADAPSPSADHPPAPAPPPPAPVTPPAEAASEQPRGGRHRRAAHADDDDFANTDWLAT